ncbi:Phenylalanyl-tRNA synthetase beta chain [Arcticibacter svalbardensis MN12-7]|uniref:Phenylalanine--tRNA ligase beta subunit n=1 Tax=Arcticibacter svalbardensis MN12-7 TaxID=1150600 RepID=R9GMC5_9SPHI|nr:phenylalanine--tRNA ligase subunit beta [Arcticibacter svalbardensis]EOR92992.1 Phenylalanyl-tRNA synthetase beta chain [Arcticibacter svalbardensis MN12-7]
MKISYNWLSQFIYTTKTPDEISLILTDIGLEVESLEKVQAIPGGLEGLVVGYVKTCVQHPNADRLKITQVNVGGADDIQVVCGAANVAAGQKVIVATVGTTVHPIEGDPFKINKSKIRGEVSEGMICAEDEIGLGNSHEGIMVLEETAVAGTAAQLYFKLKDDFLFEIGLTPNRADAASHLGVARDLAAFLRTHITMPDLSAFKPDHLQLPIPVEVMNDDACLRYSSLTLTGITVKESPDWLKEKLQIIGIRPINNVVDITNYVLHDLGQPLHAFNVAAITGGKVIVRNAVEGEVFVTLDGVERKLSVEDLMICNAEKPMCIAGVFGGAESGVSMSTTSVFLESACFSPVSVRKTSKRFGLKTDASFRFERGTDPEMTIYALKRAALLIKEIAGGEIASEVYDYYPNPVASFKVSLSYHHVNRLIGASIPSDTVKEIIEALNIKVLESTPEGLELEVPSYKVDVTREVDVIEEVLRIYGYNNIAIPTQIRASLSYGAKPDKESVRNHIAELLSSNAFSEILTNSLTKSVYSESPETAVRILNPLSSDLDVMRQSLLYSGLEAIVYNQNRRNADLKFYEFGKVYETNLTGFKETQRLSVFMTGSKVSAQWNHEVKDIAFYNLKAVVDAVLKRLAVAGLLETDFDSSQFNQASQYKKGDKTLVYFGMVSKGILKKLDIDQPVYYADFDWDLINKSIRKNKITYKEVSKFPAVRRDLSLLLDKAVTFSQLKQLAFRTEKNLLKEVNVFDVYEGKSLPEGKKSYAISFLLQDEEKTLTDKQIDSVMNKLIFTFGKEVEAEVRK